METLPRYWPFVRGIYRSPVNSPHKGPHDDVTVMKITSAPGAEAHIACQDELSNLYVESTGRYYYAICLSQAVVPLNIY